MQEKQFTYKPDWDNDGMLDYENAKTIKRYLEIKEEQRNLPFDGYDMFCAFTTEDFKRNRDRLSLKMAEGEKIVHIGVGVYGLREGIDRYFAACHQLDRLISEECDPQEVYVYEYNNHESCIAYDGDLEAIRIVISLFGEKRAEQVRRYCAYYPLEAAFNN